MKAFEATARQRTQSVGDAASLLSRGLYSNSQSDGRLELSRRPAASAMSNARAGAAAALCPGETGSLRAWRERVLPPQCQNTSFRIVTSVIAPRAHRFQAHSKGSSTRLLSVPPPHPLPLPSSSKEYHCDDGGASTVAHELSRTTNARDGRPSANRELD